MKKLLIAVALLFASSTSAQYPTTSFTAGGNITAASASCLATNCVPIKLPASATTLTVGVTGTFSATLAVEESQDGGRTWTSAGSNITGTGTTSFTITAFSDFRVRASAYVSGNAGVNILVSASTNSGGGGSGVSSLNTLTGAVTLAAGTNVTLTPSGNTITIASTGGGGAVSSVSNSDGSLVISPTTGTVVASLNPANANTWTALQTFGTNISIGGVTPTGATGTGNAVFSSSPTLTTPALGTPSALVLTNATGLPFSAIASGTNTTAAMVCGTGCSLGVGGTGTIDSTSINGVTVTGVPAVGNVPIASSGTAAVWGAQGTNPTVTNGNLFVSPGCPQPSAGNCIFTPANQIQLGDVVTTISTTVNSASANFQCPGAVFPCSSGGDVGKEEFATGNCNGAIPQTLVIPEGQIVTVNTAHQIIVSVAAVSAGGSRCMAYGNLDDTSLTLADTTAQAASICFTINLPPGLLGSKVPHFFTQPPACQRLIQVEDASPQGNGMNVGGAGPGPTTIIVYPSMNMQSGSTCAAGPSLADCWGGVQNSWFHDMAFTGLGYNRAGLTATKSFFGCTDYMLMTNMLFDGLGGADSDVSFTGLDVDPTTGPCNTSFLTLTGFGMRQLEIDGAYISGVMSVCCAVGPVSVNVEPPGRWSIDGVVTIGGTPSSPTNQVLVLNDGFVRGSELLFFNNGSTNPYTAFKNISTTQTVSLNNSVFATPTVSNANNIGFFNVAGSLGAYLSNSTFSATGGSAIFNGAAANLYDQGGLQILVGTVGNSGNLFGSASITGKTLVTGNVVLTSGWGSGAAASAFSGNSQTAQWTSTIGTTPSTTAVTTVTFPTPFFSAPTCTAIINGGTSTAVLQASCSATATAATITYLGTLVSGTVITTLRASN